MAKIKGTSGNDSINGTPGNDKIEAGAGDDVVQGGAGNDKIEGEAGNDSLFGGQGNDELEGGTGNDYLSGGQGNDELEGARGNDVLVGGAGNDEMEGGAGDDTFYLDAGNDEAEGGTGNDTFYVSPGNHEIEGGEDPDGKDIDVLDLTGAGRFRIDWTGPESGVVSFLDDDGNVTSRTRFEEIEKVICFTPGTGIATMNGERPVEELKVGDRVFTRDNGAQKIRWIGRKKVGLADGSLTSRLQPVMVRKGALGHGLPERDMLVSPNHRLLVAGAQTQLHFEETEVLVAAKHLVGRPGIEHWAAREVEYIHFLCDSHEIVLSNGAWTETFQPSDHSLSGLGEPQREEIFTLFPELRRKQPVNGFAAARRALKKHEARLLI